MRVGEIDVRAIRQTLQMTQEQFARRFGLSLSSVREWEQGRARPDKAAQVLLKVVARSPNVVDEALQAAS